MNSPVRASAPSVWSTRLRANWLPIALLVAILVVVVLAVPSFFQSANLLNVGRQSAIVGVIAIGMTFVILTGGIDLSVGSILALSGVTTAMLINSGMTIGLAAFLALLVGVALGVLNGLGVAVLKIQPFIMTLATMVAIQGLSLRVTDGGPQQFDNSNSFFTVMGSGNVLGVPGPFLIFLVISVLGVLVLRYLPFGRFVYAIGGSLEAARLSGVRTGRTVVLAYAVSGLCAALAGVMTASRLGVGDPIAGSLSNLDAITAVVIGGTSLMGGIGGAVGTVFGALMLAVLSNLMNLIGISPFDQQIVKGAVIVIAVLIAAETTRRRFRTRRPDATRVPATATHAPLDPTLTSSAR
ncbi:ABC transporter permease [Nakamurella endophytica]|uniref:Ribose ABC transporter permease n=1 Tax=Nakamurella endophytica TaxID=1748367 RepID=A0A917TE65_9ACTN|nr:ABC transporter permease [Nakamurella endophytica]GGM18920.1 ribose ABC transporter permease [Nakamurella endophytica]